MTHSAMTNREQSLRVDMAAGFRWLQRWEMHDLAAGSLVARLPGNEDWMFTHTQGIFFNEIRASDLFKVGFDLRPLDASNRRSNHAAVNPAKWIFEARPEVNAVVHVHPPAVVATSALKCGILPITPPAFFFQEGVAWVEAEFHFGGRLLQADGGGAGRRQDTRDSQTMRSRRWAGRCPKRCISPTPSPKRASCRCRSCRPTRRSTTRRPEEIEDHIRSYTDENCRKKEDGTFGLEYDGTMEWPGLLRTLDREEPDYRN